MPTRERPADRGKRLARAALVRIGADFRQARIGAGLSLREVARALKSTHTRVRRFERGEVRSQSTDFVGACCAVVDLWMRTYPAGDPLRDRSQRALLERFRVEIHPVIAMRQEVGLPIPGDLRAWDAVIGTATWEARVEAETMIDDGQALQRKLALKLRDGGGGTLILLVADTRANRAALAAIREALRPMLPHDTREILTALRAGRDPPGSGIVVL